MENGVWTGAYRPDTTHWHGLKDHFTSNVKSFYQDNSLDKHLRLKTHSAALHIQLIKSRLMTKARLERLKLHREALIQHNQRQEQLCTLQSSIRTDTHHLLSSVVCIQKHVRGWLCRLHFSNLLIEKDKKIVLERVESLGEFTRWLYVSSEKEVLRKVAVIQKAYRRYKRLKMISVLRIAYFILKDREIVRSCLLIESSFRRFLADKNLKNIKFQIHREEKLHQIRRNLAILRISSLLKSLGLTVKSIKSKFRRMKRRRRIRSRGSPRRSTGNFSFDSGSYTSIKDPSLDSKGLEEGNDTLNLSSGLTNELRESAVLRERKRWEEMRRTMEALGYRRPREVLYTPVMEGKRGESPGLWGTTELMWSAGQTQLRREWEKPRTATPNVHKRSSTRTGRYMDPTESFANWLGKSVEEPKLKVGYRYWRPRGKVLEQTVAWAGKRRVKSQRPQSTCSWRPISCSVEPEYIPALSNPAYPRHKAVHPKPPARPQTSTGPQSLNATAPLSSRYPFPSL